jgi:5'-methylthioadenosine phosphorylase
VLIGDESGIRPFTFFEKGVVGHVGFADPFDGKIGKVYLGPG